MSRFIKLIGIMSICLVTSISAQQDAAGDYKLNGVLVTYTDLAREQAAITVYDAYGLGLSFDLVTLMPMDAIGQVVNGPVGGPFLEALGVNLNVSLYEDGTGAFTEGSTYPTIELDEETCVTAATILPVTDYIEYQSDMANIGGNVATEISILGQPSLGPYAGQPIGTFGLSVSEVFDYFPQTPTYIDLDGDGTIDLPGVAQGYITDNTFEWIPNPYGGMMPAGDVYMEWHAIDGAVSQSGFGDIRYPDPGWDEDGDGTPLDRILGVGAIPVTTVSPDCIPGLNYPVFGDLSETLYGLIEMPNGLPFGYCSAVSSGDMGYIMDASLLPLGGMAGPFLTYNAVMTTLYGLPYVDDSFYDLDPTCLTTDTDGDGYPDGGDCSGRIVGDFAATCYRVLEERQVYIDFNYVSSSLAGDANLDGGVDVLDVVTTVGHVLGQLTLDGEGFDNADMNSDGNIDVLDVVGLVDLILNGRLVDDATSANIKSSNGSVEMESNGFVGAVQMTLSHDNNFSIEMTTEALVADYHTVGNKTTLMIVAPEGTELFSANGEYTIDEVLAATTDGYINVSVETPKGFSISSAYPNPFNPATNLTLDLNTDSNVSISVYNVMGQLVDVLVNESLSAGSHPFAWNASKTPSGLYFIKTEVGSSTSVQKVMLLK